MTMLDIVVAILRKAHKTYITSYALEKAKPRQIAAMDRWVSRRVA